MIVTDAAPPAVNPASEIVATAPATGVELVSVRETTPSAPTYEVRAVVVAGVTFAVA